MKKIDCKDRYHLEGKTVYREKSDCSYWTIGKYCDFHGEYEAVNCDTDEIEHFKPADLIGDFIV